MHPFQPDLRNLNTLWAGVLVESLVRAGAVAAVVSPGSRSSPLAVAAATHPGWEAIPVLDERSAGFFALGLAKRAGRPAVLLCTSGTAAANYLPAVIEASEAGVPLVVLTADRPPELRGCASGQTIDQQKLYGAYVRWYHELAVPELDPGGLRYVRQTIVHAVTRSLGHGGGPVHLNVPFRDPLAPTPDGGAAAALAGGIDWERFFRGLPAPEPVTRISRPPEIAPEVHGVIVVGPVQTAEPEVFAAALGELAGRLGWPVLADALSPVRQWADRIPHLVTTYDTILRHPAVAERLRPEVVLGVGGWPVSKVLRAWLEAADADTWLVTEREDNRDALHGRTRVLAMPVAVLAGALPEVAPDNGYQRMWARYEARLRPALDARLEAETGWFEPKAVWLLGRALPEGADLFLANSMPVRDAEYVLPAGNRRLRLWCNRGANGIDGTLSTALGLAHGSDRPAVLLTGDLSFLHDANGLLLAPRFRGSLTVVVINNRGGGIFEHLPIAQVAGVFEDFFATPQAVDLGRLAAAHGVPHALVADWAALVARVASPEPGVRILEVSTDRKQDAAQRKRWFAELAAGLGSP